jgi:hypothetical protein
MTGNLKVPGYRCEVDAAMVDGGMVDGGLQASVRTYECN